MEFKPWPKIGRDNPFMVTITEKIDGTNSCIVIEDGEMIGVQSRKRFITPEQDNYGFAQWVKDHHDELLSLGDGYHYGEWAGLGIQKNHHDFPEKRLLLFNTFRWNPDNPNRPDCCDVVPILFNGLMDSDTIPNLLAELKSKQTDKYIPEGVVVYYHAMRSYTKHTLIAPDGKWCK